jgi:molybdopterin synthase sulfur carrier subunit
MRIEYFGQLAERLCIKSGTTSSDFFPTVGSLREKLVETHGEDKFRDNTLCAVNHEFVKDEFKLKETDEVAFFPPVTGG